MALPSRLKRICRSRAGSPRTIAGTSGCRSQTSSSCFWRAGTAIIFTTSRTNSGRSKSISSSSSLPDSILEKSRMSLMTRNRVSPEPHRHQQVLALFGGELGIEHQPEHADHAIQRGANLVTHVGQELALGAAGALGSFLGRPQVGIEQPQVGGLPRHFVLQAVLVGFELPVAALDLHQHFVEAGDQFPTSSSVSTWARKRVVAGAGNGACDPQQTANRAGDDALQSHGEKKRNQRGVQQYAEDDGGIAQQPRVQLAQMRVHHHGSQAFAIHHHRAAPASARQRRLAGRREEAASRRSRTVAGEAGKAGPVLQIEANPR